MWKIDTHKAYKFRIYPAKTQMARMDRTLDLCRWDTAKL